MNYLLQYKTESNPVVRSEGPFANLQQIISHLVEQFKSGDLDNADHVVSIEIDGKESTEALITVLQHLKWFVGADIKDQVVQRLDYLKGGLLICVYGVTGFHNWKR